MPWIAALVLFAGCTFTEPELLPLAGTSPVDPVVQPNPEPDPDPDPDPDPEPTPDRPLSQLSLSPTSYGFGEAPPGCDSELVILLRNEGQVDVEVLDVSYASTDAELVLAWDLETPFTLAGGEVQPVRVAHRPLGATSSEGTLTVTSDAQEGGVLSASQTAGTRDATPGSDAYVQSGDRSVDILWVVDSSCSMALEQEALAANFGFFLDVVDGLELDYQVGVVTADMDDDGVLQGPTRWVTPDTPNAEDVFADNVLVGQTGSGLEQGFDAALTALTGDPSTAENAGFLRSDAGLRVVFVSDEDDQSFMYADPLDYVGLLQGTKANPGDVVLSDITGGAIGCLSDGANADPAPRYLEATEATGGLSTTICGPGWVNTLEALGWLSDSRSDTFGVSEEAVPASVSVTVDGVNTGGWSYDAGLQAIVFEAEAVPGEGADVVIDYLVAGSCSD